MAHIQIPDTTPRVQYSVGATPDSDFTIPFPYFADADIVVYVDDTLQTITTDYTVSGTAVDEGYSGGTVNMVSAVTNAVVTIYRDVSVARSTDFPTNGQFDITQLNTELDKMTMMIQQNEHNLGLTLRTDQFDEADDMTLPAKDDRKGTVLAFNETTGNPEAGPDIADAESIAAVSADIALLADIQDGTVATNAITDVAAIASETATVGSNIADVNTVAAAIANVNTVAGVATEVALVAAVDDDVVLVAAIDSDVTAVAAIDSDVTTAATNVADITNFADVYQGGKASDPTTRNDSSPLQAGDMYFNTTVNELRAYSGTQWVAGTAGTMSVQRFNGDDSTTAFTLSTAPAGENNTQVYIDGVYQQKDTYGVSGTTLTFSEAPPSGTDNIEVVTISTLALGETSATLVDFTQQGTGAVSRTVANKLQDVVSVKDFGAVGDGVTDDTAAIQAAIDAGKSVLFLAETYKISGTITLPSNSSLQGTKGTKFLGKMTSESTGGYPNQMFYASSESNIHFSNIYFDFAKDSFNFATGAGLTSQNSLKFMSCSDVSFEDCEFYDFVTNLNSSYSGTQNIMNFGMAQFNNCDRVSLNRIKTSNIREEGFNFYESSDLKINDWYADGVAVTTSTHAAFWYCDGVIVDNARFIHNGGSAINCYSRNVDIKNIRVNEGQTQQGYGINFDDQLNIQAFEIGNISVTNSTLNVEYFGINMGSGNTYYNVVESINFSNNRIYVKEKSNILYGIRLTDPKSALVQNNYIYLSDTTVSAQGNCVLITLQTDTSNYDWANDVVVSGNHLRGSSAVSCTQSNDTSLTGLFVRDNTFISQDIGALNSAQGASVFVYFRHETGVSDLDISDVYVENNSAYNLGGSPFVQTLNDSANVTLSNMHIHKNHFVGVSTNMVRGISVGGTSVAGNADLYMSGNIIENGRNCAFTSLKRVHGDRNVFSWPTTAPAFSRVDVFTHNGSFEWTNNRSYGVNSTYNDITEASSGTYNIVNISGNAAENTSSTLVWTSTMPSNTTLPN